MLQGVLFNDSRLMRLIRFKWIPKGSSRLSQAVVQGARKLRGHLRMPDNSYP